MWLSGQFYEATGGAIGGQALEDGIRILEARAVNEGPEYEPFMRVGRHGKNLYLDLCDARWRAVEITAAGWSVVDKPAVKLLRSSSMRALPEPESGGMIEELRGFFNVRNDEDFMLVVAWLVAALRDHGPYPVLVINGEQGAGKSVFSRMVRSLIDPSAAPIRAVPKDDRDLVVSAGNSWALVFDNLSSVPAWFADALCRLATGSGFATRMLHTDRSEMIFDAARPIILNGIPSLTDRADLADRALTIHLATIAEDARDPEDELLAAFEAKRPAILGALLDAVSCAPRSRQGEAGSDAAHGGLRRNGSPPPSRRWAGSRAVPRRLPREPPRRDRVVFRGRRGSGWDQRLHRRRSSRRLDRHRDRTAGRAQHAGKRGRAQIEALAAERARPWQSD